MHALAARLVHLAEVDRVAARRLHPELLLELAPRVVERILLLAVLALGYRPGVRIALGPERTAHVPEQHLDAGPRRHLALRRDARVASEYEQAIAPSRRHRE